jgi:hypothetical protein
MSLRIMLLAFTFILFVASSIMYLLFPRILRIYQLYITVQVTLTTISRVFYLTAFGSSLVPPYAGRVQSTMMLSQ